jgi:hypothetical protein
VRANSPSNRSLDIKDRLEIIEIALRAFYIPHQLILEWIQSDDGEPTRMPLSDRTGRKKINELFV